MKYCDEYAALLDLFVDGELTPAEMADVQAHLDCCPGCRGYVDDALAMRAAFPEVEDIAMPEGFTEQVMAAVAAASAPKKSSRKTPWLKVAMPLAACLALVIVLQNGPVTGSRGFGAGGSKATAVPSAAPAMAEAAAEAPAAAAPLETAPGLTTADIAVAEAKAEESVAEPSAAPPMLYAAKTTASLNDAVAVLSRWELPAEAARFLDGFSPVAETDAECHYHLTADEASALQDQLGHAGIAYLVEDGVNANTDMILVVLKK
jgi:anti-sigma factor RsiW